MGPDQNFLTRVGSGQPFMVWVRIRKISPKNVKFFNFFTFGSKKSLWVGSESTQVKAGSASYLLQVKSKLGSGQGPSLVPRQFLNSFIQLFALLTQTLYVHNTKRYRNEEISLTKMQSKIFFDNNLSSSFQCFN